MSYHRNVTSLCNVLEVAMSQGVKEYVFASSAAVYGEHEDATALDENHPTAPISPFGRSKLASENVLNDAGTAYGIRFVILRQFNVGGADLFLRTGNANERSNDLIRVVCQAALGKREKVEIFGADYNTPDGTAVRDYVDVSDIATAYALSLKYLREGGDSLVLNCGSGRGTSVSEVLAVAKRVSGMDFAVCPAPRRRGDPTFSVADSSRLRSLLHWQPRFLQLDAILMHALAWEQRLEAEPITASEKEAV
jgi:UDP-glucose 4-epimerase